MKILVVSPHPNDETLGCGGTILKHKKQNDELYWLILTGVSEQLGYTKEFVSTRASQIKDVSKEYKFVKTYKNVRAGCWSPAVSPRTKWLLFSHSKFRVDV